MKNIKRNTDNLMYYSNNKSEIRLKITDYNYKIVKNFVDYEKRNKKIKKG